MTLKEFVDHCGTDMLPAEIAQAELFSSDIVIARLRQLRNYDKKHKELAPLEVDFFTIKRTDKGPSWYIALRK